MRTLIPGVQTALEDNEIQYTWNIRIQQARTFYLTQSKTEITGDFSLVGDNYLCEPVSQKAVGIATGDDGYIWVWAKGLDGWFKPTISGSPIAYFGSSRPAIFYDADDATNIFGIVQTSSTEITKITFTKAALLAGTTACASGSSVIITLDNESLTSCHEVHDDNMLGFFVVFQVTEFGQGTAVGYYDWDGDSFSVSPNLYVDISCPSTTEYLDSSACGRHVFLSSENGSVVKCSLVSQPVYGISWTAWRTVVPADLSKFKVHNVYACTVNSEDYSQTVYHMVGRFQRVDPLGSLSSNIVYLFDMTSLDPECNSWHMGQNCSVFYWDTSSAILDTDYCYFNGVYRTTTKDVLYVGKSFYFPIREDSQIDPMTDYLEIDTMDIAPISGDVFSSLTFQISETAKLYRDEVSSNGDKWIRTGNIISLYLRINDLVPFSDSPSSGTNEIPYWVGSISDIGLVTKDDNLALNLSAITLAYYNMSSIRYAHYQERLSPTGLIANLEDVDNIYPLFTGTEPVTTYYYKGVNSFHGNLYPIELRELTTDNAQMLWVAQDPFFSTEIDISMQGLMNNDGTIGLSALIQDNSNFIAAAFVTDDGTLSLLRYVQGIPMTLETATISGSSDGFSLRLRIAQGRIKVWAIRGAADPDGWSRSLIWASTPDIDIPIDAYTLQLDGINVSHVGVFLKSVVDTTKLTFWDFRTTSLEQMQTLHYLMSELSIMANVLPVFSGNIVGADIVPTLAAKDTKIQ